MNFLNTILIKILSILQVLLVNFILQVLLTFIYLFIFGCVGSSLLHTGFLQLKASGDYSSLRCAGFSLWWFLLLQSTGSRCVGFSSCGSRALEHRLSSCGARAQLLRRIWDLPGPGLKPASSASAGGFLTTVQPGKSATYFKNIAFYSIPLKIVSNILVFSLRQIV